MSATDIQLRLAWNLVLEGESVSVDPRLFELLNGIRAGGNLNFAARECGVSYRHAWGLIRDWERRFDHPLIHARQGRGARLSELGAALVELERDIHAQLVPRLDEAALEAGARIAEVLDAKRGPLRLATSNSTGVDALRTALARQGFSVSAETVGSVSALQRYRRGEADLAGFHLPQGELGRTVAAHLIALLDNARDEVHLLEIRSLGLMASPPTHCERVEDLPGSALRFINRQAGSATRLVFDGLLGNARIAPGSITGYEHEEFTHRAVAALVASGAADVGFGARDAAEAFALTFQPLVQERFYLVLPRRADTILRRAVRAFADSLNIAAGRGEKLKRDEYRPSVAVLKRVHNAGFWKPAGRPAAE